MLSERNKALVDHLWPNQLGFWPINVTCLNRLLDAARAEGGAGEGLATRQLTEPGSTAPPEAISPPPPPGGVEELVMRVQYRVGNPSAWDHYDEGASELFREAADALLSQARLLEERTRALENIRDNSNGWQRDAAHDALSIVRKEKGSSQGCGTSSAPPFANHAHEVPAAGAVSPGEEG